MRTRFIITILLALIFSACSLVTQAPLPTETLQPVIKPTFTELPAKSMSESKNVSTPESESTATMQSWNNMPLNLPDISIHAEKADFITLETSANLHEVETYFLDELPSQDWLVIENLLATKTQFDGEAIFMRFLKDSDVNCVLIGSQAGKSRTTLTVATINFCSSLRKVADELRTEFWLLPKSETWKLLTLPEMNISYPST